jgi:hypothetical protein
MTTRTPPDRHGVAERETMRDYGTDCVTPHEIDGADHRDERPEELVVEHRYNGWTNYETWNVALYLNNEEPLYRAAVEYANGTDEPTYEGFIRQAIATGALLDPLTPDGVRWLDSGLDHEELDEVIRDHKEGGE